MRVPAWLVLLLAAGEAHSRADGRALLGSSGPQVAGRTEALRAGVGGLVAGKGESAPTVSRKLEPGRAVEGSVAWPSGDPQTFLLRVPTAAHALRIELRAAAADLDLYADCSPGGQMPENLENYAFADTRESGRAELLLSRDGDPPLEDGTCVVAVALGQGPAPISVRGGERRLAVKYRLTASLLDAALDADLVLGVPLSSTLDRARGYTRTYRIRPPPAGPLRIDADGEADLDLYAGPGAAPRSTYTAPFGAHSVLSRESLVIPDAAALAGRPLFLRIYLPAGGAGEDERVPFSLRATAGSAPPPDLAALPPPPRPAGPLGEAQRTTVEVCKGDLCGSGVLVSPAGHLLTALHVLDAGDGVHPGEVATVGWTQDVGKPPVHTFRAEVIALEESQDVALLQIRAGFYGQPLPPGYAFPHAARGEVSALGLGAPLVVAGYPITGGAGSLPTLTVSRGVVAGFQRRAGGTLIKTDAVVHEGNSGGPAFDADWRLVGLAVFNVGESAGTGQIGYLVGVDALPADWLGVLRAAAR